MSGSELWIRGQAKAFTAWANSHLKKQQLSVVDPAVDFSDGLLLIALLEILTNRKVATGKYHRLPKTKIHKVLNINLALEHAAAWGIRVTCHAVDVHEGNLKMILGLFWTLICRFQISGSSDSAAATSVRGELLEWVRQQVGDYPNVRVENFTSSFQDGLVFGALCHKLGGRVDYALLRMDTAVDNMLKVFRTTEADLQIPSLLDPEDVARAPDEQSVMTYVSYFRQYATRPPLSPTSAGSPLSALAAVTSSPSLEDELRELRIKYAEALQQCSSLTSDLEDMRVRGVAERAQWESERAETGATVAALKRQLADAESSLLKLQAQAADAVSHGATKSALEDHVQVLEGSVCDLKRAKLRLEGENARLVAELACAASDLADERTRVITAEDDATALRAENKAMGLRLFDASEKSARLEAELALSAERIAALSGMNQSLKQVAEDRKPAVAALADSSADQATRLAELESARAASDVARYAAQEELLSCMAQLSLVVERSAALEKAHAEERERTAAALLRLEDEKRGLIRCISVLESERRVAETGQEALALARDAAVRDLAAKDALLSDAAKEAEQLRAQLLQAKEELEVTAGALRALQARCEELTLDTRPRRDSSELKALLAEERRARVLAESERRDLLSELRKEVSRSGAALAKATGQHEARFEQEQSRTEGLARDQDRAMRDLEASLAAMQASDAGWRKQCAEERERCSALENLLADSSAKLRNSERSNQVLAATQQEYEISLGHLKMKNQEIKAEHARLQEQFSEAVVELKRAKGAFADRTSALERELASKEVAAISINARNRELQDELRAAVVKLERQAVAARKADVRLELAVSDPALPPLPADALLTAMPSTREADGLSTITSYLQRHSAAATTLKKRLEQHMQVSAQLARQLDGHFGPEDRTVLSGLERKSTEAMRQLDALQHEFTAWRKQTETLNRPLRAPVASYYVA